MTPFTLATWNINSVRLRAPHVASFVKEAQPDVIALQEIKCLPDQFPRKEFEEMGCKLVIWPVSSMRVAAKAMERCYAELAEKDSVERAAAELARVTEH